MATAKPKVEQIKSALKKDDKVLVLTGKYAGKEGKILSVMREKESAIVEKINIIKKHQKRSQKFAKGGLIEREGPVHLTNLQLICPKCSKPTRIGSLVKEGAEKSDRKRLRVCKKCNETID